MSAKWDKGEWRHGGDTCPPRPCPARSILVQQGEEKHDEGGQGMENAVQFARIDTLIPYKEPTFAPKRRMGKLDLKWSMWAIAAKLGRYLLSGVDEARIGAIAKSCAAWALDAPASDLSPFDPPEREKRLIERNVDGPYSCFLAKEPAKILVVAHHGKAKKRARFRHGWIIGYANEGNLEVVNEALEDLLCTTDEGNLEVVKLPTVLGLMDIVSSAGSAEALEDLVCTTVKRAWLERAARFRRYFETMEERGCVEMNPGEEAWAIIRMHDEHGETGCLVLGEVHRLFVYGSPSEIDNFAECEAENQKHWAMEDVRRVLTEDGFFDSPVMVGDALRELAQRRWDEEACRELNRRYAEHSACVFEDKKSCDKAHRVVAQTGYLAETFRNVEVDEDVDLSVFQSLVEEFRTRDAAGELPPVNKSAISLRFRKCGRHQALGLYAPSLNAVAVDPRAPRSLLHEFAHAYDFEKGQLSIQEGFSSILHCFRENFDTKGIGERKRDYCETPTEVFARAWEIFAVTMESYQANVAYRPLIDAIGMIDEYFLGILSDSRPDADRIEEP